VCAEISGATGHCDLHEFVTLPIGGRRHGESALPGDIFEQRHLDERQHADRRALRLRYTRSMSEVASRDLRNDTAGVLRRVREGEDVTITVNGRPVAVLTAVRPRRRRWLSKTEFLSRLRRAQADPGLREDLAMLAGDTTEDLGPIR
jgi:prevent-host-death family protein